MNTLAATLDGIRDAQEAKRLPELTAVMKRATVDLEASGVLDGIPAPGEVAPQFARPNLEGKTVRLSRLLGDGPVVVSFFRGRW